MKRYLRAFVLLLLLLGIRSAHADSPIVVGSKKFTESYVLAEIARKTLTDAGFTVEHRQGIGATGIVWEALKTGAIEVYPEYTGTIGEEILKTKTPMTPDAMRTALAAYGVGMGGDLGFDDTYAVVMRKDQAAQLGIQTIGDLAKHPDLRVSMSNEFLGRKDGWKPLSARYGLTAFQPKGIEHGLAYKALASNQIDVSDAYSTDAGIAENNLVVLADDQKFFPQYKAVYLYRLSLPTGAIAALQEDRRHDRRYAHDAPERRRREEQELRPGGGILLRCGAREQSEAAHQRNLSASDSPAGRCGICIWSESRCLRQSL